MRSTAARSVAEAIGDPTPVVLPPVWLIGEQDFQRVACGPVSKVAGDSQRRNGDLHFLIGNLTTVQHWTTPLLASGSSGGFSLSQTEGDTFAFELAAEMAAFHVGEKPAAFRVGNAQRGRHVGWPFRVLANQLHPSALLLHGSRRNASPRGGLRAIDCRFRRRADNQIVAPIRSVGIVTIG